MSDGLISLIPPVIGIPSTTNNGSLLALMERLPRIKIEGEDPGDQFVLDTTTPEARPWRASTAVVEGTAEIISEFNEATEPVKSRFFTVP